MQNTWLVFEEERERQFEEKYYGKTICKIECKSAENHRYADGDFGFYIGRLLPWWR